MNKPLDAAITINIEPSNETLVDEPIHISVTGLTPYQRVTVAAILVENGNKFVSCGHYEAHDNGSIDMENLASTGGTYTGEIYKYTLHCVP
jgi:Acyl-CoA thioester hydrolase/BAAT N-terminal region